jgi:hypothetical protein
MARPTQDTQPSRERWRIMMLSSSPSTHHITRTGFHSFLFCDAIGHQRISFRILATIHQRPILKRSQECPRRVSQSPTNRTTPHERRHSSHGRRVVVLASTTRWLLLSSQPATMPQLSLYAPIYLHHHRDTAATTLPTTTTLHVSQQQHFHNGTDRSQHQRTTRIRW